MPNIKDSLKKVVAAAKKTTTVSTEKMERMRKVAEIARKEAKSPVK